MLGCDVNETAEILNVINPMLSINQFGEDGSSDFDIPVDDSDNLFDRLSLNQIIDTLDYDEKQLIDCRYYKGQTQTVTANSMGISQVQVSRKEKPFFESLGNGLIAKKDGHYKCPSFSISYLNHKAFSDTRNS